MAGHEQVWVKVNAPVDRGVSGVISRSCATSCPDTHPCYNFCTLYGVCASFDPGAWMKYHRTVPTAVVLCFLCLVFITTPAYAYVDPNASGLVSQILTPLLIPAAGATSLKKKVGVALAGCRGAGPNGLMSRASGTASQ